MFGTPSGFRETGIEAHNSLNRYEIGYLGTDNVITIPAKFVPKPGIFDATYVSSCINSDNMETLVTYGVNNGFEIKINNETETSLPIANDVWDLKQTYSPLSTKLLYATPILGVGGAIAGAAKKQPLTAIGSLAGAATSAAKINSLKNAPIVTKPFNSENLTSLYSLPTANNLGYRKYKMAEPMYSNYVNFFKKYGLEVFNKLGADEFIKQHFNYLQCNQNVYTSLYDLPHDVRTNEQGTGIADKLIQGVHFRHTNTWGDFSIENNEEVQWKKGTAILNDEKKKSMPISKNTSSKKITS